MTHQNNQTIKTLAKSLAINYWNSSLSTVNLDYKEDVHPSLNTVFKTGFIKENHSSSNFNPLGFTRNILIIGAGASKDTPKPLLISTELIERAYKDLGIFEILNGGKIVEDLDLLLKKTISDLYLDEINPSKTYLIQKFVSHSFHYLGRIKDESLELGKLLEDLKFEGAIVVAQEFVDKYHFNQFLSKILHYKYVPSLFYEMVSHLFKHRFIDVIINLNFDEMLDNAIEDEMGAADYIRIFNDSTCIKFGNALVDCRLRKPLYIKPHGTISDIDSLKYSKSHYIDISPSITDVLKKVFLGYVNERDDSGCVKQFNIITAGFGLGDPDINSIIGMNLLRNGKCSKQTSFNTSFHIFDWDPDKALTTMYNELCQLDQFKNFENNPILNKIKSKTGQSSTNDDENSTGVVNLYSTRGNGNPKTLGNYFLEMYAEIQRCFDRPFTPTIPTRHLWNCAIFNKDYFEGYEGNHKQKLQLVNDRAKANILFDFYKFNGRLPNHVVFADRAGKYFKLYRSLGSALRDTKSLSEYVADVFDVDEIEQKEMHLEHKKFYNSSFNPDGNQNEKERVILEVRNKICAAIANINKKITLESNEIVFMKTALPYEDSITNIPFGTSHELSPVYLDNKHFRFAPFESKHIINTNLNLTWRFYFYAKLCNDWNELHIIGNTGSAFFNLDRYQPNKEQTHLAILMEKKDIPIKQVHIYHLVDEPVHFEESENQINYSQPISLVEKYGKCNICDNPDTCNKCNGFTNIIFTKLEDHFGYHKIALFKMNDEVKHAIY